jgi:hypothetical protein
MITEVFRHKDSRFFIHFNTFLKKNGWRRETEDIEQGECRNPVPPSGRRKSRFLQQNSTRNFTR